MAAEASAEIDVAELASRLRSGEVQIVDVRDDDEWAEGRISDSLHLTLNELTAVADSIDRDVPVVFVCAVGNRSAMAADAFRTAGFDAFSLAGGLTAWAEGGHELETG